MTPDISSSLIWMKENSYVFKELFFGVERETLRINVNGTLSQTKHPKSVGSALTHEWITTDFSESLLEFITPVNNNITNMLAFLRDIHRYMVHNMGPNERMWPFSMPCYIENDQSIMLATYGNSNIGRMKTIYRRGLKHRYSALMQIIAGVHYNFSLPCSFWEKYTKRGRKHEISSGYLGMIRNYYRFGWIIPYLFGASPGVCKSFIHNKTTNFPFETTSLGLKYLPYATSLRLSNLGYANQSQTNNIINITFNTLDEYVFKLRQAINTPSADYQRIGLKKNGCYLQLNTNLLQLENELYTPIRPKRITLNNESQTDALLRDGIEYVEIRSLDVNPFSPIGIDETQMHFINLFLIWCTLAEAPEISIQELFQIQNNWNRVILEGRKPGLTLKIGKFEKFLSDIGKALFFDLNRVAEILDSNNGDNKYKNICNQLVASFDHPNLTISAKLLEKMKRYGINKLGLILSNKYRNLLYEEPLEILTESMFEKEKKRSWTNQINLENSDTQTFESFLLTIKNNYHKIDLKK